MKHTPPPLPNQPVTPAPRSPPMSDQDWENYVQQKLIEKADFLNSTAHLVDKSYDWLPS